MIIDNLNLVCVHFMKDVRHCLLVRKSQTVNPLINLARADKHVYVIAVGGKQGFNLFNRFTQRLGTIDRIYV